MFLNGAEIPSPDPQGRRVMDDTFLLLFNAHHEQVTFTLSGDRWSRSWMKVIDTRTSRVADNPQPMNAGATEAIGGRSFCVLRAIPDPSGNGLHRD
jgi:isoamylase